MKRKRLDAEVFSDPSDEFGAMRGASTSLGVVDRLLGVFLEDDARVDSVTEVALALRNESMSAFIRMFRRHLGTTPARYFANRPLPGTEAGDSG